MSEGATTQKTFATYSISRTSTKLRAASNMDHRMHLIISMSLFNTPHSVKCPLLSHKLYATLQLTGNTRINISGKTGKTNASAGDKTITTGTQLSSIVLLFLGTSP